jgi:hypothetical protein
VYKRFIVIDEGLKKRTVYDKGSQREEIKGIPPVESYNGGEISGKDREA